MRQCFANTFELCASNCCSDIRHAVVVANDRMPIATVRVHSLPSIQPELCCKFVIVGGDHAALASRHNFVSIEAESCTRSDRANRPGLVLRSVRLCRVFYYVKVTLLRQLKDWIHVCRMTIQVDRDDRTRSRGYLALDSSNIYVECFFIAIDKNRRCTAIANGVRSRDKRQRRDNHLVTGTDPQSDQCEMNRCCAVVRCNRVLHFTKLSEGFFKAGKILADRRDPA